MHPNPKGTLFLKPLKVKESAAILDFKFLFRKKPTATEIAVLTRQLATLLMAGVPLIQALDVMLASMPSPRLHNTLLVLKQDIEKGLSFPLALKAQTLTFDAFYQGLCEAGEQSGTLDIMLNRLANYIEKKNAVLKKVRTALYYPVLVFFIALSIALFLLLKVIPTFKGMFKALGAPLPKFTLYVLLLSDYLKQYGIPLLLGFTVLFSCFLYYRRKNPYFNEKIELFYFKIPIFGRLLRDAIMARFARTLATTTAAGVPLMESLNTLRKILGNAVYSNALQQLRMGIASGQQLNTAMRKTDLFPPLIVQMVEIGEESGTLEAMFSKIAHTYEESIATTVDGLTTLLEPLLMVLLGIIIGGLVIAMYLPIFELGTHI
jgi:type IV pilus assembly protein PilC